MTGEIRTFECTASDPREAARQFHAAVAKADTEVTIFFCSSDYDLAILGAEMTRLFSGTQVVGCTTAGEIGPSGYVERGLVGASFPKGLCTAVSGRIDDLRHFDMARGKAFGEDLLQKFLHRAPDAKPDNSFGLLLIDGLAVREEMVANALQKALHQIPLVGGSAGDSLEFKNTHVYSDGGFRSGGAVLLLMQTVLPIRVFKTQHFVPTDRRVVVTAADADRRIVHEIDGWPAAETYARLLGTTVDKLDPMHFAASPMVVLIDGTNYVRSIQKVNPDGSLSFFCAIDEGLVLRVARGVDMVENLEQAMARVEAEIGPPQLVIGCDCILRRLESRARCLDERIGAIFKRDRVIGFNSYGEQFRGVHVNQTLTGVAFGAGREP